MNKSFSILFIIFFIFKFFFCILYSRLGQASPTDLLRAKGASSGLKFVSPGRWTCEMDRPDLNLNNEKCMFHGFLTSWTYEVILK